MPWQLKTTMLTIQGHLLDLFCLHITHTGDYVCKRHHTCTSFNFNSCKVEGSYKGIHSNMVLGLSQVTVS